MMGPDLHKAFLQQLGWSPNSQGTTCQLSQAKVVSKILHLEGQITAQRLTALDEKDEVNRYWSYKYV